MGMFDTVTLHCPHCGQKTAEQSKGGKCVLGEYDVNDAPLDVLRGLRDWRIQCEQCGEYFLVEVFETATEERVVIRKADPPPTFDDPDSWDSPEPPKKKPRIVQIEGV